MPALRKTSVSNVGPRLNLGSQGYGPGHERTAAGQGLILLSHIIRAFGIGFALVINGIVFIPFFLFAILPLLIKERLSKDPIEPENSENRHEESEDADVSPMLLSLDSSTSDLVSYADQNIISTDIHKDFNSLPGPMVELPSRLCSPSTHYGSTVHVTHPETLVNGLRHEEGSGHYLPPKSVVENNCKDRNPDATDANQFETSHDIAINGESIVSSISVPGHDHDNITSCIVKRVKTSDNLQDEI